MRIEECGVWLAGFNQAAMSREVLRMRASRNGLAGRDIEHSDATTSCRARGSHCKSDSHHVI